MTDHRIATLRQAACRGRGTAGARERITRLGNDHRVPRGPNEREPTFQSRIRRHDEYGS